MVSLNRPFSSNLITLLNFNCGLETIIESAFLLVIFPEKVTKLFVAGLHETAIIAIAIK